MIFLLILLSVLLMSTCHVHVVALPAQQMGDNCSQQGYNLDVYSLMHKQNGVQQETST